MPRKKSKGVDFKVSSPPPEQADNTVDSSEDLQKVVNGSDTIATSGNSHVVQTAAELNQAYNEDTGKDEVVEEQDELAPLPPNVTEEPQNSEQPPLGSFRRSPDTIKLIVEATDDQGSSIESPELVKAVQEEYEGINDEYLKSITDPRQKLDKMRDLAIIYVEEVNKADNLSGAKLTIHRIREGRLLNAMKRVAKKVKKLKWKGYYSDHFDPKRFRSAEKYMRIASIPEIIRYAFLGIERLDHFARIWKVYKDHNDPFGAFMERHGIDFDTSSEDDASEFGKMIDRQIEFESFAKSKLSSLHRVKVEAVIEMGIDSKEVISECKNLMDYGYNPDLYLLKVVINGMFNIALKDKEKKVIHFNKQAASLVKSTTGFIKRENIEYLRRIDSELVDKLKELVASLESMEIETNQ